MRVIHLVSNPVWGGGERFVLDLSTSLIADGHDVTVVTRPVDAVREPFVKASVPVVTMPLSEKFGGAFDFTSPRRLARMLTDATAYGQPVVVHVHNFGMARLAVAARKRSARPELVKVVCTRHLVRPAKTSSRYQRLYGELDAIIFVSHKARETFLSTNPNIPYGRLTVVHNSVRLPQGLKKLKKSEQSTFSKSSNCSDTLSPLRLLFAGRLAPEKGVDVLFKALARIKQLPWTLTLCGTGDPDYVTRLRDMSRSLGIDSRVDFAGHLADMFPVIDSHDLGVLPTIVAEACPMSVIECMSRGVPVLATSNGGQAEYLHDGADSMLIPPGDSAALAEAIAKLIDDRKLLASLSANALTTFDSSLSYPIFYQRIIDIYTNLI